MANNKLNTLKSRNDFLNLQKEAKRIFISDHVMVVYKKNSLGFLRMGWTIPGKTAKAFWRNRLKRWLRYYFRRQTSERLSLGYDLNVVFRKPKTFSIYSLQYKDFESNMEKVWKVLGSKHSVH